MVSVIIPTYNRSKTIERSIYSVLNQTYKDLELIVVDDCSNDNTKQVVDSITDERLRYIKLESNSGACVARNKGIEAAKGQFIAFQDSDDEWMPDKLEEQLKCFELGADFVFCGFIRFDEENNQFPYKFRGESRFFSQKELVVESRVSTQTIIGKKQAVMSTLFDPSFPRMQDYDFIIRASENYKIYYLDKELVKMYTQKDSITASKKQYLKRLEICQKIYEKYDYLFTRYPFWKIQLLKAIAHSQIMLKNTKEANSTLKKIYTLEKRQLIKPKFFLIVWEC